MQLKFEPCILLIRYLISTLTMAVIRFNWSTLCVTHRIQTLITPITLNLAPEFIQRWEGILSNNAIRYFIHKPFERVRTVIFLMALKFVGKKNIIFFSKTSTPRTLSKFMLNTEITILKGTRFGSWNVKVFFIFIPPGFNDASVVSHWGIWGDILWWRISIPSFQTINVTNS